MQNATCGGSGRASNGIRNSSMAVLSSKPATRAAEPEDEVAADFRTRAQVGELGVGRG